MFSFILGLKLLWRLAGLATLVLFVAVFLSGCGKRGDLLAPEAKTVNTGQAQEQAPEPRDDRIILDGLLF
jgi:predicted small lipoprotein YifL